jgi:hypothetical protein
MQARVWVIPEFLKEDFSQERWTHRASPQLSEALEK